MQNGMVVLISSEKKVNLSMGEANTSEITFKILIVLCLTLMTIIFTAALTIDIKYLCSRDHTTDKTG